MESNKFFLSQTLVDQQVKDFKWFFFFLSLIQLIMELMVRVVRSLVDELKLTARGMKFITFDKSFLINFKSSKLLLQIQKENFLYKLRKIA